MAETDSAIREMTADDIPAILRIEEQLFSDPWPEFVFWDDVSSEFSYPFVIQLDSEIVGYVIMLVDENIGHLTNLAVVREYQRKSIAKSLLSYILRLAVDIGLARITLEVRLSNKTAISLYESFGFERLAVEKDYYRNPVEDSLIMVKDISTDRDR